MLSAVLDDLVKIYVREIADIDSRVSDAQSSHHLSSLFFQDLFEASRYSIFVFGGTTVMDFRLTVRNCKTKR